MKKSQLCLTLFCLNSGVPINIRKFMLISLPKLTLLMKTKSPLVWILLPLLLFATKADAQGGTDISIETRELSRRLQHVVLRQGELHGYPGKQHEVGCKEKPGNAHVDAFGDR